MENLKFIVKNVRNDWFNLRVFVWVICVRFLLKFEKIFIVIGYY